MIKSSELTFLSTKSSTAFGPQKGKYLIHKNNQPNQTIPRHFLYQNYLHFMYQILTLEFNNSDNSTTQYR